MDPPESSSVLAPDPPPSRLLIDSTSDRLPLPSESSNTTIPSPPPPTDNFYSPSNFDFYSHKLYDSLDQHSDQIRLLKVTKDDSGQLKCRFTDGIPLAEADGTYTAISYCAGDPKKTRNVQVNGRPFNAFANLAHAIEKTYHYRMEQHGDVETVLWTDQICINQSNPGERSHQVGFMNKIYGAAREVVVCLSTEDQQGESAIDWIEDMYEDMSQASVQCGTATRAELRSICSDSNERFMIHFGLIMKLDTSMSNWTDVLLLMKQPWWSRAWVFQEYAAAHSAIFLYGGRHVSSKIISPVLLAACELSDVLTSMVLLPFGLKRTSISGTFRSAARATHLWHDDNAARSLVQYIMRYQHKSAHEEDLITLLTHSSNCNASDKRDHVYALLGLTSNVYGLVVDYAPSNSPVTLFTQLAGRIVEKDKDLRILSYVGAKSKTRMEGLPSWAPDWSCTHDQFSFWVRDSADDTDSIKSHEDGREPCVTNNCRVLDVQGICLDTVVAQDRNDTFSTGEGRTIFHHNQCIIAGDEFWVLYGASRLVVLRPQGAAYAFVGMDNRYEILRSPNAAQHMALLSKLKQTPVRIRLV